MKDTKSYEVIIIGAGPAGASAGINLAQKGFRVLILDKASFPRNKTCGDGLSPRSVNVIKKLGIYDTFKENLPLHRIDSITLSGPSGESCTVGNEWLKNPMDAEGYTIQRTLFDNFLYEQAKNAGCDIKSRFKVEKILTNSGVASGVIGKNYHDQCDETFKAPLIIACDGAHSLVRSQVGLKPHGKSEINVGVRGYYKNVKNLGSAIEIHFSKETFEGYFWIFPHSDGSANVGLTFSHNYIKKKKINLKKYIHDIITKSSFSSRFVDAELQGNLQIEYLPLGRTHGVPSVKGVLLCGDALGLIDHFSDEGIGNALLSGKMASDIIAKNPPGVVKYESLDEYYQVVNKSLGKEALLSSLLLKMKNPFFINFFIRAYNKNGSDHPFLNRVIVGELSRWHLLNPFLYLRMLFKFLR